MKSLGPVLILVVLVTIAVGEAGPSAVSAHPGGLDGSIYGAFPLSAEQACSTQPGRVRVTFRWLDSRWPSAQVQWLNLSLVNDGFGPGTHLSAGPLSPGVESFSWDGLLSGRTHYWRVNTLVEGQWQASRTQSLTTNRCLPPPVSGLSVVQECSTAIPATVRVTFRWSPPAGGASQQWVDLSLTDNGFLPGTSVGAGPLPAGWDTVVWDGIRPASWHFWRVNSLVGGVWSPSQRTSFFSRSC